MEQQVIERTIPRYRTVKACLLEIKKIDSETAVTEWFIRSLCRSGAIPYFLSGNKSLVNLDGLFDYLSKK